MTAACTAAVMTGVFVLLNAGIVGKIEIIEGPASSGAELSNSSGSNSIELPEFPSETYLYEEAAYAYDQSAPYVLKRYEVGDMFGEHRILNAKTTYKVVDGKHIRQKQEITVEGSFLFDLSKCHFSTDKNAYLEITVGTLMKIGIPQFSKDFDADMVTCYPTDGRKTTVDGVTNIGFTALSITVDYEAKTITVYGQKYSIYDN